MVLGTQPRFRADEDPRKHFFDFIIVFEGISGG